MSRSLSYDMAYRCARPQSVLSQKENKTKTERLHRGEKNVCTSIRICASVRNGFLPRSFLCRLSVTLARAHRGHRQALRRPSARGGELTIFLRVVDELVLRRSLRLCVLGRLPCLSSIELGDDLWADAVELFLGEDAQQRPGQVERIEDRPALVRTCIPDRMTRP